MLIVKQDSNGVKPLLQTGELGYDNYPAGGDSGRVYVGTGSENIPLAKKAEMLAVDGKANVHIARVDNPHGVTKAQVGLGNVEDLAPVDMPISSAGQAALNAKANKTDADLLGVPKAPTAAVGTNSTQLATTAFVGAEITDKAYSKTQLDAGQLDNRYYTETELDNGALDSRYYTETELDSGVLDTRYFTETELLNGALDVRYYTETEIDTKLAEQNDASEISYDGTVSELVATNVQDAIDEVEDRLDVVEGVVADANLTRADKYLASQNVVKMIYNLEGKLSKVRYNNDTDVDYEVLTYTLEGKLSNVAHYVESTLRGNTTLSYENGKLIAAPYTTV